MYALGQFLGVNWFWLVGVAALVGVIALNPAGALLVARWLVKTEAGRAVLLASVVAGTFLWWGQHRYAAGRAAAVAECARKNASAEKVAADQAVKRDAQSDAATNTARASTEQRKTASNERMKRAEGIAHAPRPPVPAVCPGPDADLHRELQDGTDRLRTAEGRLRDLRTAGD